MAAWRERAAMSFIGREFRQIMVAIAGVRADDGRPIPQGSILTVETGEQIWLAGQLLAAGAAVPVAVPVIEDDGCS